MLRAVGFARALTAAPKTLLKPFRVSIETGTGFGPWFVELAIGKNGFPPFPQNHSHQPGQR